MILNKGWVCLYLMMRERFLRPRKSEDKFFRLSTGSSNVQWWSHRYPQVNQTETIHITVHFTQPARILRMHGH